MSFSLTFANGEKKIYKDGEFFKLTNLQDGEFCVLVGYREPDYNKSSPYPAMGETYGLYRLYELKEQMKKAAQWKEGAEVIFAPVTFHLFDEKGYRYK